MRRGAGLELGRIAAVIFNKRISNFDEFINIMTESMGEIDSMNYLQNVYLLFLGDENTDKIELRHVKRECPWLKDEEIKEMIDKIDEDKDGKINFEEFHKIVTKLI